MLAAGGPPTVANAETGKKALLLQSAGPYGTEKARAEALGFTVTVVDPATWGAMTKDDFADYQLAIVGDPNFGIPEVVSQNAAALADAVMDNGTANTKAGNRVLIGTDPSVPLRPGRRPDDRLVDRLRLRRRRGHQPVPRLHRFDPDYDGNGVPDGQDKLLPLLTIDPTPGWTQNSSPPCGGSASLIANNDQFSTLQAPDIQGWSCSVHETFPEYPSDWNPLAVATDTPTAPTCGTDVDLG